MMPKLKDFPLVSAIMPTRARPQFARDAIYLWHAQTWPNKELVIVDDEDAPSFPGGIAGGSIRYERLRTRQSVGVKRNIACSRARGEIIIHHDDDDWYAPGRMADQVERLLSSGLELTGYHEMLFTDGIKWWMYKRFKDYILGTSFCYRKSLWERRPFRDVKISEDKLFQEGVPKTAVAAGDMMWARNHAGNTSSREMSSPSWRPVAEQREAAALTAAFLHDERAFG